MIKKIISGGQTGADRAALDVAIRQNIPHGGWVPKGRRTEAGPLPESYQMQEMPTTRYAERTERNILDADGTLIISHGALEGGSRLTMDLAAQNQRPWLHVNLSETDLLPARALICRWIRDKQIEILNVAGPRASEEPAIYGAVREVLEMTVIHLSASAGGAGFFYTPSARLKKALNLPAPKTVADAVLRMTAELPLRDRVRIANMDRRELAGLRNTLGRFIRDKFGLISGNPDLLASCRFFSKRGRVNETEAALIILEQLWLELKKSHNLRVVK